MSTLISSPFPVFTDTDGLPLENGYIDIGVAGLNPLSNPRQAYWDQALTMPASNIRTTRGYPARNGAAGFLYAAPGDFSILVRNKNGVVIFSNLNVIDNITVLQNTVLLKADLDSPALTGIPTAPTAAVATVTDQIATTDFVIQNSHVIGELVMSEFDEATSAGFPALPRNVNQDADVANWPLLVPKARSKFISVLGRTDHAFTAAGAVITLTTVDATTNAFLALIVNDAIVTNYLDTGEPANFLNGATYAVAPAQRCVTIAAVDYTIIGVNAVARQITVSVNPPAAGNLSLSPYRITGSTTKARFLRIAGFVGVAAGDAGGEVIGGFRKMDRAQNHIHTARFYTAGPAGTGFDFPGVTSFSTTPVNAGTISSPATDTINGATRLGKTTDPRTAGQYAYTWGGKFLP